MYPHIASEALTLLDHQQLVETCRTTLKRIGLLISHPLVRWGHLQAAALAPLPRPAQSIAVAWAKHDTTGGSSGGAPRNAPRAE